MYMEHSFDNTNNYKYDLKNSSNDIFSTYFQILTTYTNEYTNSKNIQLIYKKNINLYFYLYEKGINTISHIFKILLINTKNIDLVKYYSIKTIYYYIGFIEQNNTQDEDKIKYTHASLFSYKNTIYKLNKDYIKASLEENEMIIFKNLDSMIDLFNKQLKYDISCSYTL